MSTDGKYLTKRDKYSNRIGKIIATSGVTIVNNLNNVKEFPTNINYGYYLKEIDKIVSAFNKSQLSLF